MDGWMDGLIHSFNHSFTEFGIFEMVMKGVDTVPRDARASYGYLHFPKYDGTRRPQDIRSHRSQRLASRYISRSQH